MENVSYHASPGPGTTPHFFCMVGERMEGPFDLIELAAQYRYATIKPTTLVCREGEETWQPLQDMAEFASLQAIPVETIARHIEDKARPAVSPLAPRQIGRTLGDLKTIGLLVAGAIGLVVLLAAYQQGSLVTPPVPSSAPPVLAAWVQTVGDNFAIDCPVALNREHPDSSLIIETYRAEVPGFTYSVGLYRVPATLTEALTEQLIKGARDKLITKAGGILVSQHYITANGYRGLDAFFTNEAHGVKYEGGLRILTGSGRLAIATMEGDPQKLKAGDISRFLNSFLVQ